jgi:hypothetical protein
MFRLSTRVLIAVSVLGLAALAMPADLHAQSGAGGGSAGSGAAAGSATSGAASTSPGTNSLGTAQSSGSPVTTGMGRGAGADGTNKSTDAVVEEENKLIDRKVQGICRGC